MPLSQRRETEPQELARLDRRTVLKLCAASLSAAALGTGLSSCASGPDKRGAVVFKEVTRAQLKTAAGDIARTLLGFLSRRPRMKRRFSRWIGCSEKLAYGRVSWLVRWHRSIRLGTA